MIVYAINVNSARLAVLDRYALDASGGWTLQAPIVAESVELAREMVPREATPRHDCPPWFAREAYAL